MRDFLRFISRLPGCFVCSLVDALIDLDPLELLGQIDVLSVLAAVNYAFLVEITLQEWSLPVLLTQVRPGSVGTLR